MTSAADAATRSRDDRWWGRGAFPALLRARAQLGNGSSARYASAMERACPMSDVAGNPHVHRKRSTSSCSTVSAPSAAGACRRQGQSRAHPCGPAPMSAELRRLASQWPAVARMTRARRGPRDPSHHAAGADDRAATRSTCRGAPRRGPGGQERTLAPASGRRRDWDHRARRRAAQRLPSRPAADGDPSRPATSRARVGLGGVGRHHLEQPLCLSRTECRIAAPSREVRAHGQRLQRCPSGVAQRLSDRDVEF